MPTPIEIPSSRLRRSHATLALAITLIAALCVFFVHEMVDLQGVMGDLRTNDLVRIEVRNLLVDLLDCEAGARGYLLTGEEAELEPYYRARNHIRETIRRTQQGGIPTAQLVADFPATLLLADRKLEELDRAIVLRKRKDTAAAFEAVKQGYGRAAMAEARTRIQRDLDLLRTQRDRLLDQLDTRLWRAAVTLVLMLTAVACLAAYAWRSLTTAARMNNDLARTLAQEASHDVLTGLPNRRFFDRWARQLVNKTGRERGYFTLVLIDLDGFKAVNDTLGHEEGDAVLREAALRFQSVLRGGELLARLGGDEFGLLVEGMPARDDLIRLGQRLIGSLSRRLHDGLQDGAVGASLGIAFFPDHGNDIEALTRAADQALYQSKSGGRGMVSFARGRGYVNDQ
jgi:diguanylate cyclase (GGDEF)-like protein